MENVNEASAPRSPDDAPPAQPSVSSDSVITLSSNDSEQAAEEPIPRPEIPQVPEDAKPTTSASNSADALE